MQEFLIGLSLPATGQPDFLEWSAFPSATALANMNMRCSLPRVCCVRMKSTAADHSGASVFHPVIAGLYNMV